MHNCQIMKYSFSKDNELKISRIAFGTFPFDEKYWGKISAITAIDLMIAAYAKGVNYYNSAPYYGLGRCEKLLGQFAKEVGRENILVASKVGSNIEGKPTSLEPKYITAEFSKSLDRLQTNYMDVCLLHMPDENTPIEESLDVLIDFKKKGLIKHIGISNHPAKTLKKCVVLADIDVLEFRYSLLSRSDHHPKKHTGGETIFKFGDKNKILMTLYRSIERGFLTDSFKFDRNSYLFNVNKKLRSRFITEDNSSSYQQLHKALVKYSLKLGVTLAQMSLSWVLSQSDKASVLVGFRELEHLQENLTAQDLILSQEQISSINEIVDKYQSSKT